MHSSQNMYNTGRANVDRFAGKIVFLQKNPLKYGLFRATQFWLSWLWKELEAEPVTSSQLLVHPSKLWDITLQMSYVVARWLQNRIHSRAILSKCGGDAEISENLWFLKKRSVWTWIFELWSPDYTVKLAILWWFLLWIHIVCYRYTGE